ncbi:hypothetical protein B0T14DRAFT_239542 [Immersiella caudata]|uniref:Uncharacterized protein n=1 Tax=Immersiella caudata TaxID=314043 RepID=A0AA39WT15_9PEZI|nr:hypothetical protein B0T14DRAFT_239542 [Immersiella caudata]
MVGDLLSSGGCVSLNGEKPKFLSRGTSTSKLPCLINRRVEGVEHRMSWREHPRAEVTNRGTARRTPSTPSCTANGECRESPACSVRPPPHAPRASSAHVALSAWSTQDSEPRFVKFVNKPKGLFTFWAHISLCALFPFLPTSGPAKGLCFISVLAVRKAASGAMPFWDAGAGTGTQQPRAPLASRRFPRSSFVLSTSTNERAPSRCPLGRGEFKHVEVSDTSTKGAWLPSCGVVGTYYARCAKPICCCSRLHVLDARRNCCLAWHRQQMSMDGLRITGRKFSLTTLALFVPTLVKQNMTDRRSLRSRHRLPARLAARRAIRFGGEDQGLERFSARCTGMAVVTNPAALPSSLARQR